MDKTINALFCIASPLQAICAIEAMSEYHISKYDIYVIDDGQRLDQIKTFLESKNMDYSIIPFHVTRKKSLKRILGLFSFKKGEYDYLFMGDCRLTGNRLEFLPLIKQKGKIVFLDDGAYIIGWSKGLLETTVIVKLRNILMDVFCRLKGISDRNLFTIFAKNIEMKDYMICENQLKSLQIKNRNLGNDIYFIGTNPLRFCELLGISYQHYLDCISGLLYEIRNKNPYSSVMYIPHGRDNSEEMKELCAQLNIKYNRLSMCVELFFVSLKNSPQEIWGIGSTALYTLRKLCPNAKIINVAINGGISNSAKQYHEIADIYSRNGISNILLD